MRYRHLRRTLIAALVGLAVLAALVAAAQRLVRTAPVRRMLVLKLERWLGDASGGDVSIGTAELSLVPLRLEVDSVRVVFPSWTLGIRRAVVAGVRLRPARARLDLGLVSVEGVRARAAVAPARPRRQGRSWIRVRVRQLELRDVQVEDLKLPGRVGLTAGPVQLGWTSAGGPPRGYVRVRAFEVRVPGIRPLQGSLAARLRAGDGLEAPHIVLRSALLEAHGRGAIHGSSVWLALGGTTDLAALDRTLKLGGVLAGRTRLDIRLDTLNEPFLRARLEAARLRAAGFPLTGVAGTVSLGHGGVRGRLERAEFHGGRLGGRYRLDGLGPPWRHSVTARGRGIELAGFLSDLGVPAAGLAAAAEVEATLHWTGRHIRRGEGEGVAVLDPRPGPLQAAGTVHARLVPPGLIQFDGNGLHVGQATVSWQGPLTLGDWIPSWSVTVATPKLGELVPVVNTWVGSTVLPEALDGAGDLHLVLAGPWRNPTVKVEGELSPLALPPVRLDRAVVSAAIAAGRMDLAGCVFRIGGGGGRVEGRVRWDRPEDQLDLHLAGRKIPLAAVAGWLETPVEVRGSVGFSGTLRGTIAHPTGSFALGLAGAAAAGIPLGNGSARVELGGGTFTARALAFDGGLTGSAAWEVTGRKVRASLRWPGMELRRIHPAVELLAGERGDVTADLEWPLDGVAELSGRIVSSIARLELHLGGEGIEVSADLGGVAAGRLHLSRSARGLDGSGSVEVARAGELLERLLPDRGIPLAGTAEAAFEVHWPRGGAPSVTGRLRRAELELDGRPVHLLEPAEVSVNAGGVRLEGLHATVGGDELFLRLARSRDGTLTGNLSGTLDALLLRLVLPSWEPAGKLEGVVELLGTVSRPRLEGLVRVEQASFRLPGSDLVFGSIGGTVELGDGQAVLSGVTLRVMGGTATCSGAIRPGRSGPELDLDGTARGVRYTVLPGLEARLSGSWWLRGPVEDLELGGRLVVDRAVLRRREDVAAILMDWFGQDSGPAGGSDIPRLAVHVEADRSIEARTPFVHLAASAMLDITGTPAHPGVVGRLELLEGGDIILRGIRYELDRGLITFTDPSSIEPRIDLQARAWVDVYTVTVILQGTPEHLVPTLSSDPPLQEADILSLLSLGHRTGREDEGMGAALASTILTSQINAELERRARSILAVDQLRVDPFSESTTGNPTARVTVVKQLAPNWTVVVQSNLSSNREEVVISRWYLSPGLFLEATRDTDGSYSLDVKLRRRY